MAPDQQLADRVRSRMAALPGVEEKLMMGCLVFMYNGKMCVGVYGNELMCRIDPAVRDGVLEKPGCRPMNMTGRIMKGYILADETTIRSNKDFEYFIECSLRYNKTAKASPKKKRATSSRKKQA